MQQEMVRDAVESLLDVKEDYRKFGVCGESETDALEKDVDMVVGAVLRSECKLMRVKEIITKGGDEAREEKVFIEASENGSDGDGTIVAGIRSITIFEDACDIAKTKGARSRGGGEEVVEAGEEGGFSRGR